jgi:hypothetical protein
MRTPLVTITSLLLALTASAVFAAGGKNQIQNPIFGEDCIEVMPPGIDSEACEESPAPGQSGVKVYFCDTTTIVICPEEEPED